MIGALTGCGLALEPRHYKESSVRDDATLASDGNTVTSDGNTVTSDGNTVTSDGNTVTSDGSVVANDSNVVASDSGVVEPEDSAVVMPDSGVAHGDSGVVDNDGNFVPRDSGVGHMDSATVRDSGVMDTGVRVDSGVRPDSGSGLGDSALTTNDAMTPCARGQLLCSGSCVTEDENNCGTCGVRCSGPTRCALGSCVMCGAFENLCTDGVGNRCCLMSACPRPGMFICPVFE